MRLLLILVLSAAGSAVGFVFLAGSNCGPGPRAADRSTSGQPPPEEVLAAQRRSRVKIELAQRIVVERLGLLEAAELFRLANGDAGLRNLTCAPVPGRSAREKLCEQVISWVELAESDLADAGHRIPEPRPSELLRAELECRIRAGEFPPDPDEREAPAPRACVAE
jgi:hypothetical protein